LVKDAEDIWKRAVAAMSYGSEIGGIRVAVYSVTDGF